MIRCLLAMSVLSACADATGRGADPPGELEPVRLQEVASGLERPVYLTAPPGDARLFIVEQPGRIRIVADDGRLLPDPFLDLSSNVSSSGERGLLSVAFHPDYASNGLFFVNYTDRGGDTQVERYRVSTNDPNRADRESARTVLRVEQPFGNHNGGLIVFGPDGMLYVGMGDGGSGGDPQGHGQDPGTLLGALLRIDVDAAEPYAIPPDNPFVGRSDARGEIWALGLRNPWRFSFDRESGQLYVADVGQNAWEEITVVAATRGGVNFGWNIMEGTHCFRSSSCDQEGLALPVVEYPNGGEGCSVTGGHVYRGSRIPSLRGHYLYADYCQGWIRSFRYTGGEVVEEHEWELDDIGRISSFGEDAARELYVISHGGRVFRFEPEN